MQRTLVIAGFALFLAGPISAQPAVDIHLFEVVEAEDGTVQFVNPRNVTSRPGYDNQPSFLPDGSGFLFTSIRPDDQADIYRYDLLSEEITRVSSTAESEYSPTAIEHGERISTVRVELDDTQRLWSLDKDGGDPRLVLSDVRGIGYHSWANENTLVLFVLGEPHELHVAHVDSQTSILVTKDIGRSMQRAPKTEFISFLQREADDASEVWWIRTLNPVSLEIETLVRAPDGAHDHLWTPWGSIWMTAQSEILEWSYATPEWTVIADFSEFGLHEMTRLAMDPAGQWLAIVATESAESDD